MASNQPTLLEYARFYNIAEDSTRYCPINYADDKCEPKTPIPPVEGLDPEHPEERLKEIDRRFCTDLMMEKLPTEPEDMKVLSGCLQLDSVKGNIWRGILPEVTTSDHKGEALLLTTTDERMVTSSEFHSTFAQSPVPSSPTPSVHLVVPSGPDVPVVPMNTRDVFDYYESSMSMSQSNSVDGFTALGNVPVESSNITTTSHLAGDALPPIVDPSGTVHQFVSIESDPVPSIHDQESETYASSVLSSEHPTESEFSAFVFDDNMSAPTFEVSPYNKSQPTTVFSPSLTKEKGFSIGRVGSQKAQAPRALKGKKGTKASLEPVADTGIPYGQKGIVAATLSTLHEDTLVASKGTCSSPSITRPANGQNVTQLARDPQNANDNHVSFRTPCEKNLNTMAAHTSSSVDKRDSCVAQQELFRMKLGYKSHSTGLRKDPFKPPHDVSPVDYTETPKSSNKAFGGLGSLSLFMQTRDSDGGYATSPHDPSSLSLAASTRSGQGEFSNVPSLLGDSSPGPDENPSDTSCSPSPAFSMQERVTRSAFNPPPILFLSTTLLTTHPLVVRDMERWPDNPPKLIYREYGDAYSDSRYHYDAEIILAPDTGLILTTPHELTQRYLPGHGPRDARLNGIQGIDSPLREKIFCLMHRYALLVVLICKPGGADVSRVANDSLIRESNLLSQFCDTYKGLSTTLLIPIPNHSSYIALWCFGMGRLRYELFRPGMMENITEGESEYEVALRDLGINPFAARFILDNIRVSRFNPYPSVDPSPPSHEIVANASSDSRAFDVFITMESFERNFEYGYVIGDELISKVSEVIELMGYSINGDETDSDDTHGTQISFE